MQSQQLVPVDKVFQKHVSRESPHMVPLLHLSNVGRRVGGRKGMRRSWREKRKGKRSEGERSGMGGRSERRKGGRNRRKT